MSTSEDRSAGSTVKPGKSEIVMDAVVRAGSHCNLGNVLVQLGEYTRALKQHQQAVELLEAAVVQDPQLAMARTYLRNSYLGRSRSHFQMDRFQQTIEDVDRAAAFSPLPLDHRQRRALACAKANNHVRAAAEAEALLKTAGVAPLQKLVVIQIFALSAAAAEKDPQTPAAQRKKLRQEYAERALKVLQDLKQSGALATPSIRQALQEHENFQPLRGRSDFQQFTDEVE